MCALMPTGLWSFKIKDTSSSVYVEPEFDYFVDLNLGPTYIYISYGPVVRDFESEAKTR